MASKKSSTCFSKNGPKTEYDSEEEALEAADYLSENKDLDMYPYQCKNCKKWHLAPKDSKIDFVDNGCFCKDSQGGDKRLYKTKEDAEKQRIKSQAEKGITLYVYECPEHRGWHLTHIKPESD